MSQKSNLTPYYAQQIANMRLAAEGIDKELSTQRFYGLAKSGTIETICDTHGASKTHKDGRTCKNSVYVGDSFAAWLDKYVANVLAGGGARTKIDIKSLAAEYGV